MPRLRLIAGPNGSGKTTLTTDLRDRYDVPLGQYTNPDEIDVSLQEAIKDPVARSQLAQKISKDQRENWLQRMISHSYESVMSHVSHLDYIQRANEKGFETYLYYICLSDPEINVDRVDERVKWGGHPVPEEKIQQRYRRSLKQLLEMARLCKRAYFFDNSETMTLIAEITPTEYLDVFEKDYNRLKPTWFREHVLLHWGTAKIRIIR